MKYSIHAGSTTQHRDELGPRGGLPPQGRLESPNGTRRYPFMPAAIVLAILAAGIVYIFLNRGQSQHSERRQTEIVTARTEDFVKSLRLTGRTEAVHSRAMLAPTLEGAQLSSMVVTKLTPAGTRVKKGDVLVGFDRQAQLKDALDKRAAYQDLVDQLAEKRAAEDAARAKDETELQKAEDDLKKAQLEVSKNDLVSRIDAEKNTETLQEAEATLMQLQQTFKLKRDAAAADIRIVEIQVESAKETMLYAEGNASKMTLISPMDGVTVLNMLWTGGRMGEIQEGDEVRPGVPFMKVVDPSQMRVSIQVNQADFLSLRFGQHARVFLDAYPGLAFSGRLDELTPLAHIADFSDKVRSFSAMLAIEGSNPKLMPDLSAAVDVELDIRKDAVVVPAESVAAEDGRTYVWLRDGAGFVKHPVKVGPSNDLDVVIESGLKSGDTLRRNAAASVGSS